MAYLEVGTPVFIRLQTLMGVAPPTEVWFTGCVDAVSPGHECPYVVKVMDGPEGGRFFKNTVKDILTEEQYAARVLAQ